MLKRFAAIPITLATRPIPDPTPDAMPKAGANTGKITYVKAHRIPDITIAVEKVFWAFSLLTILVSWIRFSLTSLTYVSYPLFNFPDQFFIDTSFTH
tara:strand:- start:3484 stop:3774 length:291 start_codon:yes stop_codon:yes gene_type:complete